MQTEIIVPSGGGGVRPARRGGNSTEEAVARRWQPMTPARSAMSAQTTAWRARAGAASAEVHGQHRRWSRCLPCTVAGLNRAGSYPAVGLHGFDQQGARRCRRSFTSAVGRASTEARVPASGGSQRRPSRARSSAPDARSTPTRTAWRRGEPTGPTLGSCLAPSTKLSLPGGTRRQAPAREEGQHETEQHGLPASEENAARAADVMPASTRNSADSTTAMPSNKHSTTASHSFRRCTTATARKPARVDAVVARRDGQEHQGRSGARLLRAV